MSQYVKRAMNDGIPGTRIAYFAYGCNINPARMEGRGVPFSRRVRATLPGHARRFNKIASANPREGKANIVPDEERVVEGALYEIRDSDLFKLDRYEGYPDHYDRLTMKVQLDDGQDVDAIVYIAQPHRTKEGLRPTREYLNHLLAGRDILSESYYRGLSSCETLDTFIELRYGGSGAGFPVSDLVAHIQLSARDYIVQGQQHCTLENHTKPHSLDVWLRTRFTPRQDTAQAVNQVVERLVATGRFEVVRRLECPDSGRPCKGLRLLDPPKSQGPLWPFSTDSEPGKAGV